MTLTQHTLIRLKAHKAPARRDYAPKPSDPGQPITWTRWRTGHYVPVAEPMAGVIWSAGPVATSVWVLADNGDTVALKLAGGQRAEHRELDSYTIAAPVAEVAA